MEGQVSPVPSETVKDHYYLPEQQQLLILQSLFKHNIQPEATAQHAVCVNLLTSQDAPPHQPRYVPQSAAALCAA